MKGWIATQTGAERAGPIEHLQTLWGGYGEVARVRLVGAPSTSAILKRVDPRPASGRSHARKLHSYAVERAFYLRHATKLDNATRIAGCLAAEETSTGWRFLLEDLDAAGFAGRASALNAAQTARCLEWLARFHATFLGAAPEGLWEEGSYWHLATRPDELAVLTEPRLREAAAKLDDALTGARFRTLVHGDAKPANFCFAPRDAAVAAVDFQYVGGGAGVRDVAYLLFAARGWGGGVRDEGARLDHYFAVLRESIGDARVDRDALEAEWRALYPVARADFLRFLAGWSPGAGSLRDYRDALADPAVAASTG